MRHPILGGGITRPFRGVLKKLGINGYSIHRRRKHAGVAFAEAGCSPHEIAAIVGHSTLWMVTH
jgi:hypothetical protein